MAAILIVNAAGIYGIAVGRRGALEEAERTLRLETSGRARSLESAMASLRADMAFLAGSDAFHRVETEMASPDPREARWRRLSAEGALLIFLRGHQEVSHVIVRSSMGDALVAVGRRGGVPVVWSPLRVNTGGRVDVLTAGTPVRASVPVPAGGRATRAPQARLEVLLDSHALLARGRLLADGSRICALSDGQGAPLADEAGTVHLAEVIRAQSVVRTEGWTAPSPWHLDCQRERSAALATLEPVASRYRSTIVLNVLVMGLGLLLGAFAIQQTQRRQLLEAQAREGSRVRELERQLFHAERLTTVGRFAAGIAHEINNPLEGMANYLRLSREDLERGDLVSARRRLAGVAEGLDRAAGIVRQVLELADPSGTPRSHVDLGALLTQSIEFVRSRETFPGIEFDLELEDAARAVQGSSTMLGQLFLNLLLNACEAQPFGGEVRVRARRDGLEVAAEVADRGPGVPAADRERVFEPFFSTKQSTGLGLSICHTIVQGHGGEMRIEDRPGGGAVFTVRLRAAEARAV